MSAVTVENELIHYEVLGRGRPVILLHGWLNSWRYWIPAMQQISLKYRVYALDLWGYGDSSKPPDKFTLDAHVALLAGFMDKLGIPKAALIGHSLGAAVIVRYALHNPDRVARVMVISPPVFESDSRPPDMPRQASSSPAGDPTLTRRPAGLNQHITTPPRMPAPATSSRFDPASVLKSNDGRRLLDAETLARLSEQAEAATVQPDLLKPLAQDAPQAAPSNMRDTVEARRVLSPLASRLVGSPQELLAQYLDKGTPEYDRYLTEAAKTAADALSVSVQSFGRVDVAYEVRNLAAPTLLLHGQDDRFLPPPGEGLTAYMNGRPGGGVRCELLPSVGHFPMLSDPANFHRLVMDFLEVRALSDIVPQKGRWVRKVR